MNESRELSRGAFGLIRAHMTGNTCPRWGTYGTYIRQLVRIANATKKLSPQDWDYLDSRDIDRAEDEHGILYADEMAWLYNEIGLTLYGEGVMVDSLSVWEQGYEINLLIDGGEDPGIYTLQAQCNMGAANIHFGRLGIAAEHLQDAQHTNAGIREPDHAGRILGYQALIKHLEGNLVEADKEYEGALKELEGRERRNVRAECIFLQHQGDLKIQRREWREAENSIAKSRSLAEAAEYPELVAAARLSLGHLHRARRCWRDSLREYDAALRMAREHGCHRLEAAALSELSRHALDQGDSQLARERALQSLLLANELLLGLRQSHSLVVLGKASVQAGHIDLGKAYLKHARDLARIQRYRLREREAEEELDLLEG